MGRSGFQRIDTRQTWAVVPLRFGWIYISLFYQNFEQNGATIVRY